MPIKKSPDLNYVRPHLKLKRIWIRPAPAPTNPSTATGASAHQDLPQVFAFILMAPFVRQHEVRRQYQAQQRICTITSNTMEASKI